MASVRVTGTNHTSFTVRDIDRAVALFRDGLGFELQSKAPRDPVAIQAITGVAGGDVTITAFSIMVGKALEAADKLAEDGIEAEVINLRSIRPLDTATIIASLKKTNRLVSVEEGWAFAGIGAELAAVVMEQGFDLLDAPLRRVSSVDAPLPYAANLEQAALPQTDHIVEAARDVCYASD